MELLIKLFGEGKDLNALQMSDRGVIMFVIALILIRISGRRSFGVCTPLDNIISISLGAVMSRAIVGASDYNIYLSDGLRLSMARPLASNSCANAGPDIIQPLPLISACFQRCKQSCPPYNSRGYIL